MPTRAEFRWASWRHWGRHFRRCALILALGALAYFITWLVLEWAEPGEPAETRSEYAMTVAVLASIGGAIMAAQAAPREALRDSTLLCPYCNGPLGHFQVMIVLNSGNCPHCGEHILDD